MTEENSSRSTPPPSSTLSRFPHPSTIPRLPPTPIPTNIHPLLPYTPTTPLPSSRFQAPLRTPDSHPNVSSVPFETQFQSIPEESNVHSNINISAAVQQSPEHKEINQPPENRSNAETNSNDNVDNQFDNNYVQNSRDDIQTYDHNTNDYKITNVQNNAINMQQQQIQQQLFEQQQMFDKTMIYMQQRIQQLEQQILLSQQEAAQLKFDQAYYSQHQVPTTWYTNNHGTSSNNQSINSINNVISKAISRPDNFDGNATLIDSWIYSMRNYLLLANIPVEQQVPVVTTYLKGNAQNWLVHLSNEDKSKCLTLDNFFTALVSFFRPVNLVQATRRQLNELQQRGFDLIKFNSRFNQLVQKLPPMDKQELLDKYREKLDSSIQVALAGKEFFELSKIQTAAVQVETALKQMKPDRNGSNVNHRFNNNGYNNNSRSRFQHGPTPVVNQHMNVQQAENGGEEETQVQVQYASSTMKKSKTSIPRMTEQIKEWCMDNKACFRCRQVGHIASKCTRFPGSTAGGNPIQPSATPSKQNF